MANSSEAPLLPCAGNSSQASTSPLKKARYSFEPDLDVEVEGEVFQVRSFVLMAASPVFRAMLTAEMQEGREGHIVLEGKKREEFRAVLRHLDTAGGGEPPPLEDDQLEVLLHWADEYKMEMLRARIERVLLQQRADDISALKIAVDYCLPERKIQCTEALSKHIQSHLFSLQKYADEGPLMDGLWPAIFKAAGIREPSEESAGSPCLVPEGHARMPLGRANARMLWPLVVKAVTGEVGEPFRCADDVEPGCRVQVIKDPRRLKTLCKKVGWESGMARCAGQAGVVTIRDNDGDLCVKIDLPEGVREDFFPYTALLRIS